MYKLFVKPLLFLFDAERAHHIAFLLLKSVFKIPGTKWLASTVFRIKNSKLERNVAGIKFPSPVGLAAGFDKNALLFDELSCLGFGFVEVGTVTPKPQSANEKPRLFRLPKDEALINRMGFNNDGVEVIAERLRKRKSNIIIGGNIGKNKVTLNENAFDDYKVCFEKLFDVVDYFVVNVSSPNTPGLRELQEREPLTRLLSGLQQLNLVKEIQKPIFLKIAPDLTNPQLDELVEIIVETNLAGIIATNTTIDRSNLKTSAADVGSIGNGGLSGKPLKLHSTEIVKYISQKAAGKFAIIASGGIHNADDAKDKINAGASLVQLYTGLIYEGPMLPKKINTSFL